MKKNLLSGLLAGVMAVSPAAIQKAPLPQIPLLKQQNQQPQRTATHSM